MAFDDLKSFATMCDRFWCFAVICHHFRPFQIICDHSWWSFIIRNSFIGFTLKYYLAIQLILEFLYGSIVAPRMIRLALCCCWQRCTRIFRALPSTRGHADSVGGTFFGNIHYEEVCHSATTRDLTLSILVCEWKNPPNAEMFILVNMDEFLFYLRQYGTLILNRTGSLLFYDLGAFAKCRFVLFDFITGAAFVLFTGKIEWVRYNFF